MKPAFLPIHRLLASGRSHTHLVCHTESGSIAWQEFAASVGSLADALKNKPQKRWLLACADAYVFAVWFMALLHAGKHIVIPSNSQPGTLAQLSKAYDAQADEGVPQLPPAENAPASLLPEQAIIELYTSGSTGQPKKISKTLLQFEREIEVLESLWGSTLAEICVLATVPHHHIYGLLFRLLWPLSAGRPFDSVLSAHPDTLQKRMQMLGEHVLIASPAQLSRLPELVPLQSLQQNPRIVFSSGGPLNASTAAAFHEQTGQAPTEIFGSTETGGIAWRCQNGQDWWTLFPGMRIEADSEQTLLHSPFLGCESSRLLDDVVELAADGRFRLQGRRDRVVKIEEKRLSLHDMEKRLSEHPWVAAVAAIGLQGRRQSIGVALTLTAAGEQAQLDGGRPFLRQKLREHLAHYYEPVLLPRYWRYVEQLPFNAQGKLTQAALTELFARQEDEHAVS